MQLENTKTKENLMRAFAGECQARMRYTFAASTAKAQKLPLIEAVFTYTAGQEKEHAEIFMDFLKEFGGKTVTIGEAGYPVDPTDSVAALLRAGQHNEFEEHDVVYKAFGEVAEQEGFPQIASAFQQIAKIEKTHGERFGKFAELLETNKLFVSDVDVGWICLNCGHIHTGKEAPMSCPVCHHEQGYFIRLELAPYQ